MHILHVVGARPNFMKAAPVHRALGEKGHQQTLIHTGQHYDTQMSEVFFEQLAMPNPDENLKMNSKTETAEPNKTAETHGGHQ